ncbi:MAG: PIG-L deacetylase family protein [Balneolaceae bacterium]
MNKYSTFLAIFVLVPTLLFAQGSSSEPEIPIEEWTGRTILLVGAHPDDDAGRHGTLAMLQANGNDVYVMLLTSGNVGTRDRTMTRQRLEKIRRHEQINALTALNIPEENYINLGYTDGMVEFADKEELVKRMVWWYRKIQPDVLISFEPGYRYVVWHKNDHRSAAYLAVDAARAAEWHLIFPEQVIQEGLEPVSIREYMYWGSEAPNMTVDISDYVENKIQSRMAYLSQFTSLSDNYPGTSDERFATLDDLPEDERKAYVERMTSRTGPTESFRYRRGAPDGAGSGPALGESGGDN